MGSGCGSVGRAVASNPYQRPAFESNHPYHLIMDVIIITVEKTKVEKNRSGMVQFKRTL